MQAKQKQDDRAYDDWLEKQIEPEAQKKTSKRGAPTAGPFASAAAAAAQPDSAAQPSQPSQAEQQPESKEDARAREHKAALKQQIEERKRIQVGCRAFESGFSLCASSRTC